MDSFNRIFDIVDIAADRYGDTVAFAKKVKGEWKTTTYSEYKLQVTALSIWLLKNGVTKADNIVAVSGNRPEWNVVDMASTQIGAVFAPLYPTYSKADIKHILTKCLPKVVFVAGPTLFTIVSDVVAELKTDTLIVSIDENTDNTLNFNSIVATENSVADAEKLAAVKHTITPDDYSTIVFTSGTGGDPNGALFKHLKYVNCVKNLTPLLRLQSGNKTISYLPICHSFERLHNYCYQYSGVSTYYAENAATVMDNMIEVQPTMFCTVPLLLERAHVAITGRFGTFDNFKQIVGGNLTGIISAGAPLPAALGQKYEDAGVQVLECYGISECNFVSYSVFDDHILGKTGRAAPGVELKIADDGEICIKSPYLFEEYYKDPELTKVVLKDGWYHSGDLGEIDAQGFVIITGRKRDVFKVSSGKFIYPELIEKALKQSDAIENSYVFNYNHQLSAMVIPGNANGNADKIKSEVESVYNSKVLDSEKIKTIFIDESVWSIENGLLTPTMKIKRAELVKYYKGKLENLTSISL